MASVGVALVNGVQKPGYLFAPGFVGDGSQLLNVHTSNINHANTGQLAYYINSTTIGGNAGLSFDHDSFMINGNLYVSGTTFSVNNITYENSIFSIGTLDSVSTKGILIVDSHSNVMISYTNTNNLTIGYTHDTSNDIELFPDYEMNIQVDIIGDISANNFSGNGAFLKNTVDIADGVYGDKQGLMVPCVTILNGRPSLINLVTIQSSLESVTNFGTSTLKSIQFENEDVSFVTSGKVGISNTNPDPSSLLSIGNGVKITNQDVNLVGNVTASKFIGNGAALIKTTDAQYGTYGDGLNVAQVCIDTNGRLSKVNHIPIQSTLEKVTGYGNSTNATIKLTNKEVALTTVGCVGISNNEPNYLLCIGNTTRFDDKNLHLDGSVEAINFIGNAAYLTNTVDLKPGRYGSSAAIPQIIVDQNGRITEIIPLNIAFSLNTATQNSSFTHATIQLLNKQIGLVSEGDVHLSYGKDIVFIDHFNNKICTIGQHSEYDSKLVKFSGISDAILNIDNWSQVSINNGLTINEKGLTTMKGCFMETGTGYMLNAQQLSTSFDTLNLETSDLFKWFSFSVAHKKIIQLPDATSCQAGSWIGITNISEQSDIEVFDYFGTTMYTIIRKSQFVGGNSCRLMCVSSLASANGTTIMGGMWIVA